jgi:oligopeptide/dipeptide ABC transporter ATP-binding protein
MTTESTPQPEPQALLQLSSLEVSFSTPRGDVRSVRKIDLTIAPGEIVALVGESGSGKSATALAIMDLLPANARVRGSIRLDGTELVGLSEDRRARYRGSGIAIVFQNPMSSLNPVLKIARQISDVVRTHDRSMRDGEQIRRRCADLLERCGLTDVGRVLNAYPHELSGGMRQRVAIALALACNPMLLIADEPTTALDVTIQAGILDLLQSLRAELGMSILLITHDLGVVARLCDRTATMYAGEIVEAAGTERILSRPQHPYTARLIDACVRPDQRISGVLRTIPGSMADLVNLPAGCTFADRCTYVEDNCREHAPPFERVQAGGSARCWVSLRGDLPEPPPIDLEANAVSPSGMQK